MSEKGETTSSKPCKSSSFQEKEISDWMQLQSKSEEIPEPVLREKLKESCVHKLSSNSFSANRGGRRKEI